MTSRNNILSYVLVAIALLTGFSSCISLDEYTPTTEVSGDIEFVVRPTSYNGQVVQTKATNATDFENSIHNCYLLLFNSEGNQVFISDDMAGLSTYRISKSKIISLLGGPNATCTACFVANVPADVVKGLTTLSAVNSAVLDINYSNVDVLDANGKHSSFVVPDFDLDGSESNEPVQCLPMFGMEECNLGTADLFEISLKRLFAKVNVNIALGSILQGAANFKLVATHLTNLPTKVNLIEKTEESTWVKDPSSFLQNQIEGPINQQIYIGGSHELYFYVPEYYLTPLTKSEYTSSTGNSEETYDSEKYKPKKYDSTKKPVLLKLFGQYDAGIGGSPQDVAYELYLGEDASTSFTLKRNRHYKNTVTINGIANSMTGEGDALDWRVDVSKMDEVQVLGQTANCYVIGEAGTYIFPACKGVWTEGLSTIPDNMKCSIKGTQIEIIAQDSQSISLTNLTYNPDSKEFSFDVTNINDGNVIVGLTYMENGVKKVEWSWHLWFVTGVNLGTALEGFFDVQSQTMPNAFEMMDRNIGVNINVSNLDLIPGTIKGIYYRYGHRAPYFTDVRTNGNGTKYHGLNESDYSTWNTDKKSVTDPCPPGYRVPASSVWNGNATHEHAEVDLLGYGFIAYRYWNNGTSGLLEFMDDIYYPYPGFVNYVNGSYTISPYESVDNTTTPLNANDYSTFTRTIQTDVTYGPVTSHTFLGSGYNSRTATFTEHIYTEFKYEVKLSTIKGELWASDSHFYKYETKSMGNWDSFAITQCKHAYRSAQREEQQVIAFGRPVGDFAPIVPDYTYGELVEDSTPLTSNSSLPDTSLGTVNNTTWKTALQTNQRNREFTSRGTPVSFTSIPNEGYQVRCVRE